jgi:hypothetical protein
MIPKKYLAWAAAAVLSVALVPTLRLNAQEPDPSAVPPGIEVQTRGPIHEAFAQPNDLNFGPSPAVPKAPPPPLPEQPPDVAPQGDNAQWIGGYWAWDAERNDFIWVSGTYRNAPPGRQFVPGHWVNTAEGWRWVPGFWAPVGQTEFPFQPPAPLETEPSLPPPDDNSMYVPGYWAYQGGTFAWRPGFYSLFRDGRIWVSPRYVWSPAGYTFVDGYWDYALEDRGLLFAPVWFTSPLWQTPGWFYRPYYCVLRDALLDGLFWRSGWNHYYFGNFYGPAFARLGFQPWFARRYDPLFNYYRWSHRGHANWAAGHQRVFNERVAGRAAVPPRTFAQQTATNRVVAPITQVNNNVRVTRITSAQKNVQTAQLERTRQLSQARITHENAFVARGNGAASGATVRNSSANSFKIAPQVSNSTVKSASTIKSANVPRITNQVATPGFASQAAKTAGAPRVVNHAVTAPHATTPRAMPRVVNHAPAPTARTAVPQARSSARTTTPHSVSQPRASSQTNHAGRTVNHAPTRSGGSSRSGGGHSSHK